MSTPRHPLARPAPVGGRLRIGSLCTGYGGLDLAVMAALNGELAWCADNDPDASAVLAARFPDAPNLGDLTRIDWGSVPPADVVTAGFPCQDISYAGRGAGIEKGTRSGLWAHIAGAVRQLRPTFVFVENVAALRTRGLGRVLADLAALGYDAQWTCLRASGIGATHPRDRAFLLAHQPGGTGRLAAAAHTTRLRYGNGERTGLTGVLAAAVAGAVAHADGGDDLAHPAGPPGLAARAWQEQAVRLAGRGLPAAHASGIRRGEGVTQPARLPRPVDADLRGRPPAPPAPHPGPAGRDVAAGPGDQQPGTGIADRPATVDWGPYEPAIRRWEHLLGLSAPLPSEPARRGGRQLSAAFVEWMLGLPPGFVTGIQLPRSAHLRLLGNGVVPQQAAAALRQLIGIAVSVPCTATHLQPGSKEDDRAA
jgi:DNA (cytosine-5)-methyltransferase 1